jgi:DNA-binding response OmpR family regulator
MERRHPAVALRLLVADDERDIADTLADLLRAEGHVVQSVYRGSDVLPAVRVLRPDAVILDIAIPGISGYAVAQAIRSSFTDMRRPLMIAMSGFWTEAPDRRIAAQVGFDHHLVKPCEPQALLGLLAPLRK